MNERQWIVLGAFAAMMQVTNARASAQAVGNAAAEDSVHLLIARAVVDPFVFPNGKPFHLTFLLEPEERNNVADSALHDERVPAWNEIVAAVTREYGERYADRAVLRAKVLWAWSIRDWSEFGRHLAAFEEKYGAERSRLSLNNAAWTIFITSDDREELNAAASWMARYCEREPQRYDALDTYANLLYKLGRVADAVVAQEKAVTLAAAALGAPTSGFQRTLTKMKRGEPTWDGGIHWD